MAPGERTFTAGQAVTVAKDGQRLPGTVFRRIFANGVWMLRVDTPEGRLTVHPDRVEPAEPAAPAIDDIDYAEARGVFVDGLAGLFSDAIRAGVTERQLRADFEACLTLQDFGEAA